MTTETLLMRAESIVQPWAREVTRPASDRLDLSLASDDLMNCVDALVEDEWGYLSAITGVDLGVEAGAIEILYHFCSAAAIVTLRVQVARDQAVVSSICDVIPSASFYERELGEMLGVTVAGTPNPDRLFLPDDWPAGVYPLRKDFEPEAIKRGV